LFAGVIYAAAFLALWFLSVDQWYLPAGLRAAALLCLRPRWWPYLYAGDAAAVLFLRLPQVGDHDLLWAFLPAFALLPLISIAPAIARVFVPDIARAGLRLPFVLAGMAVWTALWMQTLNAITAPQPVTLEMFVRWAAGYYLGMLVIVPPLLVYLCRRDASPVARHFLRDVGLAAVVTGGLYLAVMAVPGIDDPLRVLLLLGMIAPALALTGAHGWRGAALGVALASVAIALTLPRVGLLGAHDAVAFVAQLVLAVAATVLLLGGALLSRHFETLRRLGVAEQQAKRLARAGVLASERQMRDRVMLLAQMQGHLDEARADLVRRLRAHGNAAAAMEVLRDSVLHAELFEAHVSAVYPIAIETDGLFDALHAPGFALTAAGGRDVRLWLRGQPKALSVDVQVAAYRIVGSAIALLSATGPQGYRVRARVWKTARMRGIALQISADGGGEARPSQASILAEVELESRVQTHGGAVWRRRGQQVSVMLPDAEAPWLYRSVGAMDQASPAAV
jgi:glucose-6-phosphate-specific signal transduction histidine kinase